MGANSNIEWTDHTFNHVRGCTKVSEGCKHCYAETLSKRNPAILGVWGPQGTRVMASEAMWREPLKWNEEAKTAGKRRRVFCASLADVFEGPETCSAEAYQVIVAARERLFKLIDSTPHLDWLLLTKRPENILKLTPWGWGTAESYLQHVGKEVPHAFGLGSSICKPSDVIRPNVWIGTSVENQAAADKRIPELLKVPAKVRFLSCEPLLGPVNLGQAWEVFCREKWNGQGVPLDSNWLGLLHECPNCESGLNEGDHGFLCPECGGECSVKSPNIHWVIAGGESGPHARPMHTDWARSLRDQCQAAGVAFHFKQWGEWAPVHDLLAGEPVFSDRLWHTFDPDTSVCRVGKASAGRLLDGRTWDEMPEVNHA